MMKRTTYQNRIFRTLLFFTLGILAVFVISLVNFYLFLSQHYIVYCENVLTQVNGQIENVLHKMTLSQKEAFLTICDSPLYKSDYYDESVMFSGRKIVTSLANISYNNDDIDNIFVHMYRNDGFYSTEKSSYNRKGIREPYRSIGRIFITRKRTLTFSTIKLSSVTVWIPLTGNWLWLLTIFPCFSLCLKVL